MKTNQMRKPKAIYSELLRARVSDAVTCLMVETQKQTERVKLYIKKRERERAAGGRLQVCPN